MEASRIVRVSLDASLARALAISSGSVDSG